MKKQSTKNFTLTRHEAVKHVLLYSTLLYSTLLYSTIFYYIILYSWGVSAPLSPKPPRAEPKRGTLVFGCPVDEGLAVGKAPARRSYLGTQHEMGTSKN